MLKRMAVRHNYGPGMQFVDDDALQAYVDSVESARADAARAGKRYTVPPRLTFMTCQGVVLNEGDELVPARDLAPISRVTREFGMQRFENKSVALQLADLIFEGRIIEADVREPPEAA